MVALQLLGQTALIVASFALGAKLIALWRRTRELPELSVGLSFVLFGGFGYASWLILAGMVIRGGDRDTAHAIATFGLVSSCTGAIAMGIGNAAIFRPGRRWPAFLVGALAIGMATSCVVYARAAAGAGSFSFWVSILQCGVVCAWGGAESLIVWRVLRKRARLGLADPVVVHRAGQWGVASLAIVLLIALTFSSRLAYGRILPPWVNALSACFGLVGACAIWLGFFPPRALRERLVRAYAG